MVDCCFLKSGTEVLTDFLHVLSNRIQKFFGCGWSNDFLVHLLGKSLHYLDEENNPKQAKSENNRLELRSDILITLDNEIKRWQDILSVDYNKWLFDD